MTLTVQKFKPFFRGFLHLFRRPFDLHGPALVVPVAFVTSGVADADADVGVAVAAGVNLMKQFFPEFTGKFLSGVLLAYINFFIFQEHSLHRNSVQTSRPANRGFGSRLGERFQEFVHRNAVFVT
jgi:hypothetical protein